METTKLMYNKEMNKEIDKVFRDNNIIVTLSHDNINRSMVEKETPLE